VNPEPTIKWKSIMSLMVKSCLKGMQINQDLSSCLDLLHAVSEPCPFKEFGVGVFPLSHTLTNLRSA
jgi:hypothetical protein